MDDARPDARLPAGARPAGHQPHEVAGGHQELTAVDSTIAAYGELAATWLEPAALQR